MERNLPNTPKCSRDPEPIPPDIQLCQDMQQALEVANTTSETSHEIANHSLEYTVLSPGTSETPHPVDTAPSSVTIEELKTESTVNFPLPFLLISAPPSFVIPATHASRRAALTIQSPITSQPLSSSTSASKSHHNDNHPPSLFLQALAKLSDNKPINVTVLNNLISKSQYLSLGQRDQACPKPGEISPPDSLTSAPPSYSYVLRQMAVRRRPRLMGTFIPSPSFIPHVPPPNYNAAFDIYVDNTLPPPPARVRRFGFTSVPTVCPECGFTGMSVVTTKVTICTHLCAVVLCLLCCWVCAPLPYVLRSCKDVYHHCRNCRYFLGMYCPTSTEPGIT